MPIRKGKLHKNCIKCGKLFEPTGRQNKLCNECKPKSWLNKHLK